MINLVFLKDSECLIDLSYFLSKISFDFNKSNNFLKLCSHSMSVPLVFFSAQGYDLIQGTELCETVV